MTDIVGIALTPDDGGYYMAGTDGQVYGFGDAHVWGAGGSLPLTCRWPPSRARKARVVGSVAVSANFPAF